MHKVLLFVVLGLTQMPWGLVLADDILPSGTSSSEQAQRLDRLFDALKTAPNEQAAFKTEQTIWIEWTTPDDPQLAALMQQVLAARRVADYDKALAILDRVIKEWCGYAEGWNQRATVYFLQGEFEKSLEAVAETLAREPRHFGALVGRGMIYLRQGKLDLAVQDILAALQIHPYLPERGLIAGLQGDA